MGCEGADKYVVVFENAGEALVGLSERSGFLDLFGQESGLEPVQVIYLNDASVTLPSAVSTSMTRRCV